MRHLLPLLLCILLLPALGEEPPEIDLPQETAGPMPSVEQEADPSWLSDSGILKLVNRDSRISKAYAPRELVTPKVATRKKNMEERILLRPEAARALEAMFTAAMREGGHTLYAASGYRSYGVQQILFNGKVQEVGSRQAAQKTVAPAGTSEHQLGLAMDIQSPSQLNLNRSFGDTDEGKWVALNAHRFGYIVRYKREWTDITGYLYEPWHIRYIGEAHARAVHFLGIPYETYIGRISALPEYVLRGATDRLLVRLAQEDAQPPIGLLSAADSFARQEALKEATLPLLPAGASYEETLWAIYPTPKPTAGPRVDEDEESELFRAGEAHGIAD